MVDPAFSGAIDEAFQDTPDIPYPRKEEFKPNVSEVGPGGLKEDDFEDEAQAAEYGTWANTQYDNAGFSARF